MIYWKCPDCDSQAHHKGLCRNCTKYDSDGKIQTPVSRERVNGDGTHYVKINKRFEPMEISQMKAKFLAQRRRHLTKKQKALAQSELKALKEAQVKVAEEAGDDGVLEIGDVVGVEEE